MTITKGESNKLYNNHKKEAIKIAGAILEDLLNTQISEWIYYRAEYKDKKYSPDDIVKRLENIKNIVLLGNNPKND